MSFSGAGWDVYVTGWSFVWLAMLAVLIGTIAVIAERKRP
jgi:hypothetical protein